MSDSNKLITYIEADRYLRRINNRRRRNMIIHQNHLMNVVYDIKENELNFESSIPFSDIEHDTNRKYTEQICKDIMLNFKNRKKDYIRMLSNPRSRKYKSSYKKYIKILKGESDYTDEDILIMISILGRLNQERLMGPISVRKDEKLNPDSVKEHNTTKEYIVTCIKTIKEYSNYYLQNKTELKLINGLGFDGLLDNQNIVPNPIPLLTYGNESKVVRVEKSSKIRGNALSPNYISSFFSQLANLEEFKDTPIMLDDYKDIIQDLIEFSQRFRGGGVKEISALGKVKSILLTEKFDKIMSLVETKIFYKSRRKTYYEVVSKYLLDFDNELEQKIGFYKLVKIYEKHINDELADFKDFKDQTEHSNLNDNEISIASDMHFNSLDKINKSNYSSNFNIIAGDFYNNLYHRGGIEVKEVFNINGIGVLGNHDIYWLDSIEDIGVEVITNYERSISVLKELFPSIRILNNEVYYTNGVAFVGLSIVADEDRQGNRSFFANADLGGVFDSEDYIKKTKELLNSVDPNMPIVVISHSPFKDYAVCRNKEIGIYSNKVFKDYPNVKMYIHGHGHSVPKSKIIDNILCVTNPIVNNIYTESSFFYEWKDLIDDGESNKRLLNEGNFKWY